MLKWRKNFRPNQKRIRDIEMERFRKHKNTERQEERIIDEEERPPEEFFYA